MLYLWTMSDAIDDALAKKRSSIWDAIDGKMLALIGAAVAAIVVVYMVLL